MADNVLDTTDIERSVLMLLRSSKMAAASYLPKIQSEYFTSEIRKFIFGCIGSLFKESKSILTKDLYYFEVERSVDASTKALYKAEWSYVADDSIKLDSPDGTIEKLKEIKTAREILSSCQNTVRLIIEEGRVDDAIANLKTTAINVKNKEDNTSIVELANFKTRCNDLVDRIEHPEKNEQILTGFETFDRRTGFFPEEFILMSATAGTGKSTMCKEMTKRVVTHNKQRNVLHICNEETQRQVEFKYDTLFTEMPYGRLKRADMTLDEVTEWENMLEKIYLNDMGRVFIKEVPAMTDVTLIEQAFAELDTMGIPIHFLVIDHLPHVTPINRAFDKYDEQAKAATDIKQIARSLRVPVLCPTQADTATADKQEKKQRAGDMAVYGSKGQIHVANVFMVITDRGFDDTQEHLEEWQRDRLWLCDIKKNRDDAKYWWKAKHHVRTGHVEEIFDDSPDSANRISTSTADYALRAADDIDG